MLLPKTENNMSSTKAPAKSKETSSKTVSKGVTPAVAPREGTSANPSNVLGLNASMLDNPTVAEKLLKGVIPPSDPAISRLFHGVGQVTIHFQVKITFLHFHSSSKFNFLQVVMLVSSLVGHGRELREG